MRTTAGIGPNFLTWDLCVAVTHLGFRLVLYCAPRHFFDHDREAGEMARRRPIRVALGASTVCIASETCFEGADASHAVDYGIGYVPSASEVTNAKFGFG